MSGSNLTRGAQGEVLIPLTSPLKSCTAVVETEEIPHSTYPLLSPHGVVTALLAFEMHIMS